MDLGVIGGQDGPTAILVSGNPVGLILLAAAIAAAIGAIIWLLRRGHKR